MFTQLNPPLRFYVPHMHDGATAIAVIDYGVDFDLMWICVMDKTGEVWTLNNNKVRGVENLSAGRGKAEPTMVDQFIRAQIEKGKL